MQAAFLGRVVLPPPAPGPLGLAGTDGTGAGLAADRDETPLVQRVERDAVLAGEGQSLVARPVEQRVELDQVALAVDLGEGDAATRSRLVGPQPGDPGCGAGERAAERLDLADIAASLAGLDRIVEAVDPVAAHEGLDGIVPGIERRDRDAVARLGLRPKRVDLTEEPTGIERDDFDRQVLHRDQMGDDLILEAEAGGEDEATRDLPHQPCEAFGCIRLSERSIEVFGLILQLEHVLALGRRDRRGQLDAALACRHLPLPSVSGLFCKSNNPHIT